MNKGQYAIFFILAIILICYTIYKSLKLKDSLKTHFLAVLGTILLVEIAYVIYLFSGNFNVMKTTLAFVYIGVDVLILILLGFINVYTGHKTNKVFGFLFLGLVVLDLIFFITSIFTDIGVSYITKFTNEEMFVYLDKNWLNVYSMVLDYVMVAIIFVLLAIKTAKVPTIYKVKYYTVLIAVSVIVIINLFFILTQLPVDLSKLFYGLFSVALYHFILDYTPHILSQKTQDLLLNEMSDGIIVFNFQGEISYINKTAKEMFGDSILKTSHNYFKTEYPFVVDENDDSPIKFYCNKGELAIEVEKSIFIDKKGRLQAYYYILHDVTFRVEQLELREYQSTHDELTGIYNRAFFFETTQKRVDIHPDNIYSIIGTNFVGFRLVNDLFGVEAGNKLLKDFASLLIKIVDEHYLLFARMGADNFALFVEKNHLNDTKLLDTIYKGFLRVKGDYPIDLKFGICDVTDCTVEKAYERAVMTLHFLKGKYDEHIDYYDDDVRKNALREKQLLLDLDTSIKNNDFCIYLQPQVNSYNKNIVGAEALVRWNHPKYGMISPGEFIPLFEKHLVIYKLDLFVWEEACKLICELSQQGEENLSISVNISAIDFYYLDVCEAILRITSKHNIHPNRLNLEITESAFIQDQKKIVEDVMKLKNHGFIIEMDDFGCGNSSFNSLKDIPINVLKLDMKFLDGDIYNKKTIEILDSIIGMAHRIHLPVIAEGVETEEQSKLLREMDCEINQGYLFAKPMSKMDFKEYIKDKETSSFIHFWAMEDKNKELFSTIKEVQRCFNTTPVPVIILEPVYIDNKIIDMKNLYCNPAFATTLEIDPEKIKNKCLREVFNGNWKDEWMDIFIEILKTGQDKKRIVTTTKNEKIHIHAYSLKERFISVVVTYLK